MRRFVLGFGTVLAFLAAPALVQAQSTKRATGSITTIAADSVTIKTGDGKDMTFAIDGKTQVIAPGGSTKSRAASAEGKGVTASELLKSGQAVEVRYHETGMHAASIRAIASVPSPSSASGTKSKTASGVVSAVSGNSLTVKGSSNEWTFTVDEKTTVSGTGIGTAGRKLSSEGKKTTLTDFVHDGDSVSVTYHEADGAKVASVVRVTKKKG